MANSEKVTVVLDVMGADSGVDPIVNGGVLAARKVGESLTVHLVGQKAVIEKSLAKIENLPANIEIEDAPDVVPMGLSATDGVRMKNSSISVGLRQIKGKSGYGFVSPGNTGAVMATALLNLGRLKDVSRPAITATFPTSTGSPTIILDVGANADCKPQHLSQFAVMGSVYYSILHKKENPRVGLISIGEERSKGNELIFGAQNLLKDSKINFVGNIEGRDLLSGAVDVAVTDGFTGNILLKFAESVKPLLVSSVQRQVQTNIFSRMGVMLLLPFMRRMRNLFDYAEAGGAPLLGVNGNIIICHGASNARAIDNAVTSAYEMSKNKIRDRIHEELISNRFGKDNGTKIESQDTGNRVVCSTPADD